MPTLCNPSKLEVITSSLIFCLYFCLALLATSLLKADVPLGQVVSPNGIPSTDTTDVQQQVSTRLESFTPASTSGLFSDDTCTLCSFCQSVSNCDGHSPPISEKYENI